MMPLQDDNRLYIDGDWVERPCAPAIAVVNNIDVAACTARGIALCAKTTP